MKMKTHIITEAEYIATKMKAKSNKNKRIDKRLQVIILRYEGNTDAVIAEKLGYARKRISQLCAEFKALGLDEYARQKYKANNRALTEEEEKAVLDDFEDRANKGEIITIKDIKAAFVELRGKDTGSTYIYRILKRHNWRKVMPRSKHPKSATPEEVESSKKLTQK